MCEKCNQKSISVIENWTRRQDKRKWLLSKTKKQSSYQMMKESGMMWVYFPELTGIWEQDRIILKKLRKN